MLLTIEVKDSVADKVIYLLDNLKEDVKILNSIEKIDKNDLDYNYILDARKARINGEKVYNLEDVIKEFEW